MQPYARNVTRQVFLIVRGRPFGSRLRTPLSSQCKAEAKSETSRCSRKSVCYRHVERRWSRWQWM